MWRSTESTRSRSFRRRTGGISHVHLDMDGRLAEGLDLAGRKVIIGLDEGWRRGRSSMRRFCDRKRAGYWSQCWRI